MKKIAIIGAGPAGIFLTLLLKDFPGEVFLMEQNKDIGEKLKTTGGGRMNVTNRCFDRDHFFSHQGRTLDHFFKNPIVQYPQEVLKELGIEFQWEKDRAILASQDAVAEVARLKGLVQQQRNATLCLETKVQRIDKKGGAFQIAGLQKGREILETFNFVVIATGGMFRMGDLGPASEIYRLSEGMGHKTTQVRPSLSALAIASRPFKALSGISLEVELIDPETKKSVRDDIMLAHFGITGPGTLDFSSKLLGDRALINFMPQLSEVEFIQQFNASRTGKNHLRNFMRSFVPLRVADFLLEKSGITQDFMADVPKKKLQELCQHIFRFEIKGLKKNDYPGCWTTKGGVDLALINPATLESKKHSGLFFAGEVLDMDGLCGGFNISLAAVSAKIAAVAMTQK